MAISSRGKHLKHRVDVNADLSAYILCHRRLARLQQSVVGKRDKYTNNSNRDHPHGDRGKSIEPVTWEILARRWIATEKIAFTPHLVRATAIPIYILPSSTISSLTCRRYTATDVKTYTAVPNIVRSKSARTREGLGITRERDAYRES